MPTTTRSTSACSPAWCGSTATRSRSGTSWRGWRSRPRSRRAGAPRCTVTCWQRLEARGCRPGATRPPRRGRGRRRGRAPPRDRGRGACRAARRAPPGGRAVRPRAALGGRHGGRASGPSCSRSSATSATSPTRSRRRSRPARSRASYGARSATLSAKATRCAGCRACTGSAATTRSRRPSRSPRSSSSRRCRPARSWRWRTRTARSSRCCRPTCRRAQEWGGRAIALAERLGDDGGGRARAQQRRHARSMREGLPGGAEKLRAQPRRWRSSRRLEEHVARAYCNLSAMAVQRREHVAGGRHLIADGLAYCARHDLDSWRAYIVAWRAVAELTGRPLRRGGGVGERGAHPPAYRADHAHPGARGARARSAPGAATRGRWSRSTRRWRWHGRPASCSGSGQVAAARAEVAWLSSDPDRVREETEIAWELAAGGASAG